MRRALPVALVAEPRALRDAEPMLLVDHDQPERAEPDALREQRVRADHHVDLPGREHRDQRLAHRARRRRGEQRDAQVTRARPARPRLGVLLGEQLGRRHHRGLPARARDLQRRRERDTRLARADIALEQAVHRRRPREIVAELADRAPLRAGQLERQRARERGVELRRARARHRHIRAALAPAQRHRDAEREQLAEREPSLPPAIAAIHRRELVGRDVRPAGECSARERVARATAAARRASTVAGTPSSAAAPTRAHAA